MDNRVSTLEIEKSRYIVGRILPGSDLIQGIHKICIENNIESGVLQMAIGSFSKINIVHAKKSETEKMGIKYSEPKKLEGPYELLSTQGLIGINGENKLEVHLHGIMVDENFEVLGGHFLESGNIVLATVELEILVSDKKFLRNEDEETGFKLFKF